jgi:molecular chaperone GrpE (heat shock protein)
MLIEASSDREVLAERSSGVKAQISVKEEEVKKLAAAFEQERRKTKALIDKCKGIMSKEDDPKLADFLRVSGTDRTVEELEAEIESERARLELMHEGNGGVITEFEGRRKKIDGLKSKLSEIENGLVEIGQEIAGVRARWEPELDRLVKRISRSFAYNMKQINCAGEVSVYKDEQDFDKWAIQIHVKFRYAPSPCLPVVVFTSLDSISTLPDTSLGKMSLSPFLTPTANPAGKEQCQQFFISCRSSRSHGRLSVWSMRLIRAWIHATNGLYTRGW